MWSYATPIKTGRHPTANLSSKQKRANRRKFFKSLGHVISITPPWHTDRPPAKARCNPEGTIRVSSVHGKQSNKKATIRTTGRCLGHPPNVDPVPSADLLTYPYRTRRAAIAFPAGWPTSRKPKRRRAYFAFGNTTFGSGHLSKTNTSSREERRQIYRKIGRVISNLPHNPTAQMLASRPSASRVRGGACH